MTAQDFSAKNMPNVKELEGFFQDFPFEHHYRKYFWKGNFHKKLSKTPDEYPSFHWIKEIETEASRECKTKGFLSQGTVIAIFKWGTGGRHSPLIAAKASSWQSRTKAAQEAISQRPNPLRLDDRERVQEWIEKVYLALVLGKPGIGLTYYSKILRFMSPVWFGAYDVARLGNLFAKGWKDSRGNIFRLSRPGGNREYEARAYARFCWVLQVLASYLNRNERLVPTDGQSPARKWLAADVEMALFNKKSSSKRSAEPCK